MRPEHHQHYDKDDHQMRNAEHDLWVVAAISLVCIIGIVQDGVKPEFSAPVIY
jgi:hypothetical protein